MDRIWRLGQAQVRPAVTAGRPCLTLFPLLSRLEGALAVPRSSLGLACTRD